MEPIKPGEKVRRTSYSQQFKQEAVRLVTEGGNSMSAVARELGVSAALLGRWKKQWQVHQGNGARAFPGHGNIADEEQRELARLRRENQMLRQEQEILKKAVGIFTRHMDSQPR